MCLLRFGTVGCTHIFKYYLTSAEVALRFPMCQGAREATLLDIGITNNMI